MGKKQASAETEAPTEEEVLVVVEEVPETVAEQQIEEEEKEPTEATAIEELTAVRVLPLGSGITVEMEKISLSTLVSIGKIPNNLLPVVLKMMEHGIIGADPNKTVADAGADDEDDEDEEPITPEQKWAAQREYIETLEWITLAVVVKPQLMRNRADENAKEGKLWIGRLSDQDKQTISLFATADLRYLANFRVKQ